MHTTIRAVDVGYGNTKYTLSHSREGEIPCGVFASIVAPAVAGDLSDGALARRNTATVRVNGCDYEVGPDAELVTGAHAARVLHGEFLGTSEYLALLRGALHYMEVERIDLLVVGLPVSYLADKAAALRVLAEGTHALSPKQSVQVAKALVLAQPLGGLAYHAMTRGLYGRFLQTRNLIVDPGYYTVDWLTTKGLQPLPKRCGSFAGGMHAVARAVARTVASEERIPPDELPALDAALRDGYLTLFGRRTPLQPRHLEAARGVTEEAAHAIANSVGTGRDIEAILLVGGGADLYREALARRYPKHAVHIVPEPVLANVRGFQLIGEEVARRRQAATA